MFDDIQKQEALIHSNSVTSLKPECVLTVCYYSQRLKYLQLYFIFVPKDFFPLIRMTLREQREDDARFYVGPQ